MKKFIETLKNIFKIEELRKRILYTFGLIMIFRIGSFIVIPGINPNAVGALSDRVADNGLMGLLDIFSGGAFGQASILALGIMPYISASIIIQLLGIVVPYFQKLQKEGESGRRKMNQLTRYLTILVLCVQAPAYLVSLHAGGLLPEGAFVLGHGFFFKIIGTIVLIAGTMFTMWIGEKITDKGIGNGVSLIITVGIVARLPHALWAEVIARGTGAGGFVFLVVELAILAVIFALAIALVQAVRRVPVQYAKRIVGNKQYGGVRQFIPMKINAAGVMPIIFAQALMFIPMLFQRWEATRGFAAAFGNPIGFWYNFTFFMLVLAFTYFYTAITINTTQMADDMKKNGGFIPGIKPGKQTANYLDNIMTRITLPGSIFLGLIAILPAFAQMIGINQQFAAFFGGTSLLILVGVVLDTLQQIESHLLSRHYDGLMKTGRLKGRQGM